MKITFKIKTIITSLLLIVSAYSCSDLDQEFYGDFKDEDLWNTKTDFDQAINGALAFLDAPYGFYTREFFLLEEASTDYFIGSAGSANEFAAFKSWGSTFPTSFGWALWGPLYQSILQSNLVLDRLDKFPVRIGTAFEAEDLANKNRIKGEALFFRALNYYNLQNTFGGVPVVISSYDKRVAIPKSTREEVRQLIEKDLSLAATLLPDVVVAKSSALLSRPSKQAAYGLLARLYINWDGNPDRWKKTVDACDEILIKNPSNLGLESDYKNIFSLANEKNKEIIYAIEHNIYSPPFGSFILNNYNSSPDNMRFPIGAQIGWGGDWMVTNIFASSTNFGSTDKRKNQLLSEYIDKDGNIQKFAFGTLVNKYPLDPVNLSNAFGGNDQPIIRYADIILMKAEALNQIGNTPAAVILVGQIRTSRGATAVPSTISKDNMNTFIYNERRREFFFEGLGRTDMIRFKLTPSNKFHDNQFLLSIQKKFFDDAEKIRLAIAWKEYNEYILNNPDNPDNLEEPTPKPFVETAQTAEEKKYLLYPFDGLAIRNNPALIQNDGYR